MSAADEEKEAGPSRTLRWNKSKKGSLRESMRIKKSKDKNDPSRFEGNGVTFRAKLIGVDDVSEARGDKMCQEAMQKLKSNLKTTKEHKQKICICVSLEGLKITDEKSTVTLHHHAVHRISFISRDVSDARAFGYVYGPGGNTHQFFAIKTEKAAESLVLTLRDLFQVVFEMKKKEMTNALKNKEILMDASKVKQLEEQGSNNTNDTSSASGTTDQSNEGLAQMDAFGTIEGSPAWGFGGDPWGSGRSQPSSDSSSNAPLSISHQGTPPVSHDNTSNSNTHDEDDPFTARSSPFMLRPVSNGGEVSSSPHFSPSTSRLRNSPASSSIDTCSIERPRPSPASSISQEDTMNRSGSLRGSKKKINQPLQPTTDPFSDDPFFNSNDSINKPSNKDTSFDKFAPFNELTSTTSSTLNSTEGSSGLFLNSESDATGGNVTVNNGHDSGGAFGDSGMNDKFAAFNKSLFDDKDKDNSLTREGSSSSNTSAWPDPKNTLGNTSAHSSPQLIRANSQPQAQSNWPNSTSTPLAGKPVDEFEAKFNNARCNTPDPFDSASLSDLSSVNNKQTWASFNSTDEQTNSTFNGIPQSAPPVHKHQSQKPDWKTFNFETERSSTPESAKLPSPTEPPPPLPESDPPAPPPRPLSRQNTGELASSLSLKRSTALSPAPPIPNRPPVARANTIDMGTKTGSPQNCSVFDINRQSPVLSSSVEQARYSPIARQSPMTVIDEIENDISTNAIVHQSTGIARSRPRPRSKTPNSASQTNNNQLSTQTSSSSATANRRQLPRQQSMPVTMNLPLTAAGSSFSRDSLERQSDKVDDQIAARRLALANASANSGKILARNQSDSLIDSKQHDDTASIGSNELQGIAVADPFANVDPFVQDDMVETDPFIGEDPFNKEVKSPTEVFETRAVSLQGTRPCSVPIAIVNDPFANDPFDNKSINQESYTENNVRSRSESLTKASIVSTEKECTEEATDGSAVKFEVSFENMDNKAVDGNDKKSNVIDAFGNIPPEAHTTTAEPDPFVVSPSIFRDGMFSNDSKTPPLANQLMGRSQLQPAVMNTTGSNVTTRGEETPPPLPKKQNVNFPTTFDSPTVNKSQDTIINNFAANFDKVSPDNSFPVDFKDDNICTDNKQAVVNVKNRLEVTDMAVETGMKRDGFSTDFTPFNDPKINNSSQTMHKNDPMSNVEHTMASATYPSPPVKQTPPITGQIPPVGQTPPITGQIPPITGQIPPIAGQPPPVAGQTPPVVGQTPPVVGQTPPIAGQTPAIVGQTSVTSLTTPTHTNNPVQNRQSSSPGNPLPQPSPTHLVQTHQTDSPSVTPPVVSDMEKIHNKSEVDPFANLNAFTYTFGSKPTFTTSSLVQNFHNAGINTTSMPPPNQPPPPLPTRPAHMINVTSETMPTSGKLIAPTAAQSAMPINNMNPNTSTPPAMQNLQQVHAEQQIQNSHQLQQTPQHSTQPRAQTVAQQSAAFSSQPQTHATAPPAGPPPPLPNHILQQQQLQQQQHQLQQQYQLQQQQQLHHQQQQYQQHYQQQLEQQLKQQQYEQQLKQQQIEQQLKQLQIDSQIKQQQLEAQLKQQQLQQQQIIQHTQAASMAAIQYAAPPAIAPRALPQTQQQMQPPNSPLPVQHATNNEYYMRCWQQQQQQRQQQLLQQQFQQQQLQQRQQHPSQQQQPTRQQTSSQGRSGWYTDFQ